MGGFNPVILINPFLAAGQEAGKAAGAGDPAQKLYENVTGKTARQATEDVANRAEAAQKRIADQLSAQSAEEAAGIAAETARNQARARQRALSRGSYGRRQTILTGPSGLAGEGESFQRKTLLGA